METFFDESLLENRINYESRPDGWVLALLRRFAAIATPRVAAAPSRCSYGAVTISRVAIEPTSYSNVSATISRVAIAAVGALFVAIATPRVAAAPSSCSYGAVTISRVAIASSWCIVCRLAGFIRSPGFVTGILAPLLPLGFLPPSIHL